MKRFLLFQAFVCILYLNVKGHNESLANPAMVSTITIDNTTPTQICGSKGNEIPVSFTTAGTMDEVNFTISLIKVYRNNCAAEQETIVRNAFTDTNTGTIVLSSVLGATTPAGCGSVSYKIVVKNGTIYSDNYPITVLALPTPGTIGVVGANTITEVGQTIHLSTTPSPTITKTWFAHGETEYWQSGTLFNASNADEVDLTPSTSTYYSVVYTDENQCSNRSVRLRIPFNVTVSGTGTAADVSYAEGSGVHLDAGGIVSGTGQPYPQFYAPPGADAGARIYSNVYDTSFPVSWNGYFIIRKNDFWEIYYGFRPTYSYITYTRLYHTKNSFPTQNSGGRIAARTSAILGTRPPQNAIWIKDADNSEVNLALSGVSEDYGALPVTLTYFNAKLNSNKKVDLTWETTSEQNSDHFTIERSADAISFETIAIVKSNENSFNKNSYLKTDENPLHNVNYYRLKQTDLDGTETTYRVVSVRTEGTDAPYPNPSNGLFLNLDVPQTSHIAILNTKGETIPFDRKMLSEGSEQLLLKTSPSPGLYVIQVNGKSWKWVVQ